QTVKEIFANQPGRPKPVVDQPPATPVPVKSMPGSAKSSAPPTTVGAAAPQPTDFEQAAASLIETGVRFFESLASLTQNAPADDLLSTLLTVDPRTKRPALSIPLPASLDKNRLSRAISAVLGALRNG